MTLAASLFEMPYAEARALLARGAPVYLAINPVEYHGPHLSLHNDALISAGLCADMHRTLTQTHTDWPFVTAGELGVGVDPVRGPGTRHTTYQRACEIVRGACRGLADMGATNVVLMTFHGAPMHNLAVESGIELLTARGVRAIAPLNLLMRYLLDVDGAEFAEAFKHIDDVSTRETMMRDLYLDFHAGFGETSLSLHYAPESVSPTYRDVPPCPAIAPLKPWMLASRLAQATGAETFAKECRLAAYGSAWQMLDPFPGYTSSPHLATADAGRVFAEQMVAQFADHADRVFAGAASSPRPIMAWVAALSANGRLVATIQGSA